MVKDFGSGYRLRSLRPEDNGSIARIIRSTLAEFGANRPGTVYFDDSTDHLFELFGIPGSAYFIVESEGQVVGGGGVYPTSGLPVGTCELVKMYLVPQARGKGIGRKLLEACLEKAKELGYKKIYLETMPELKAAIAGYQKAGFQSLPGPIGNSGHHGCEIWMILELQTPQDKL